MKNTIVRRDITVDARTMFNNGTDREQVGGLWVEKNTFLDAPRHPAKKSFASTS